MAGPVESVGGLPRPEYMRHRDRMIAYGRWEPFVPAGKAREHALALKAQGIGWVQVAALAGLPPGTVSKLLYGGGGCPPSRRIRPSTEAAILAVRPTLDVIDGWTVVDGTGTRRRLQALAWSGWPMAQLSGRLGGPGRALDTILRGGERVRASTARAVRDLYDELWDQAPPERTGSERTAAGAARNRARRAGWMPAGAWDDEPGPHCIDDPAAVPVPGSWQRRDGAASPGAFIEEATFLLAAGESAAQVAARLGVLESTLEREVGRHRARVRRAAAGEGQQREGEADGRAA